MFRTAVFDFDGTLFDTLPDIYGALKYVLDKNGMRVPSRSQASSFMGDGLAMFLQKAVSLSGENECPRDIMDEYLSYYGGHCMDQTEPYEGVSELLDGLFSKGVKMAIVSNKNEALVKKIVGGFGFSRYFLKISGGDTFSVKKPFPEPVLLTLKEIESAAPLDGVIMVGDSENDVASGRAAGVKTCWCAYGYGAPVSSEADFTAASPYEVYNYIANEGAVK